MLNNLKSAFPLGFGLMRLPKLEDGRMDTDQIMAMADRFLESGGTYFDTAYVYDGGSSEEAFRDAVARRHPRDSYTIATKLHAAAADCHSEEEAKAQLEKSLERLETGYIDYYLLHAIQRSNYELYERYHLWDFVQEQKARGKIRHWGFSFHADPELLEDLLKAHPEAEFVQLQINYADWENPGVASSRNWEICRDYGKPVTIMEPVKGGVLAQPIPEVREVFENSGRDWSCAGWALRYAASLGNLITVLSGMSSMEQMEDNLRTMKDFYPMTGEELEVIRRAQQAISADKSIPCTACHYCTEGCPRKIAIPEIFNVVNRSRGSLAFRTVREYGIVTRTTGKASDCIACRRCEAACPQHLPIVRLLQECRKWEG